MKKQVSPVKRRGFFYMKGFSMNNRQILFAATLVFAAIGVYMTIVRKHTTIKDGGVASYTIGILQTASHPALDAAQRGFIDEIQSQVGDKINFIIQNGQGSISTSHTIAQQFHAKQDIDGIFAIATPAAQAITSIETEKPVCVAAVSINSATQELLKGDNVFGMSDMIDVRAEVDAMHKLLPEAQNIGILFSTAEINSVTTADIMVKELEKIGLTPLLIGVTSEADIEPALASALRKVDVVLAPTDNMVANAIALIADIMQKAEKPLVVSDNMLVKYGALMARGVDYYESGKQAGSLAVQVFVHGKKPHELSIKKAEIKEIFVNKDVCERLGIIIPDSIKRDVVLV
jgi:putative tryptophan/tyrosine transport system substrate-binding protein